MRLQQTVATWMLVLAFLGASVFPCLPAPTETGPTASVAEAAHHHGQGTQRQAAHPPGCPEAEKPSLTAPCPCGCGDRAPTSASARLGYALLRSIPALEMERAKTPLVEIGRSAPSSPSRPIDHVPRLG